MTSTIKSKPQTTLLWQDLDVFHSYCTEYCIVRCSVSPLYCSTAGITISCLQVIFKLLSWCCLPCFPPNFMLLSVGLQLFALAGIISRQQSLSPAVRCPPRGYWNLSSKIQSVNDNGQGEEINSASPKAAVVWSLWSQMKHVCTLWHVEMENDCIHWY